ncbi:MAG: ABC transporter substrate-binding protein [Acidobacteria bacterium]|nr:ABC transporter substrate-binding protein [Acidobacteriota bacterium]
MTNLLAAVAMAILLAACARTHRTPSVLPDCPPQSAPGRVSFQHSIQLQVAYGDGYKIVQFRPSVDTRETVRLLLVQCGAPVPSHVAADQVIRIPATSLVSANHSLNAAIETLGLARAVVGVNSFRGVTTPALLHRIRRGEILETGGGVHSNIEKALALNPSLFFTFYSAYPQFNMHPKLWEIGLHAIPISDHTEPTPLARAEWIKFLALFFNKEREANQIFDGIASRYHTLSGVTASVRHRPTVLAGFASSRDIWSAHGGRNYMASLIHDAGGEYVWKDRIHGSLVYIHFERMFDAAGDAEGWVTGGYLPPTLAMLTRDNPRLAWFRPVSEANVLSPAKGVRPFHPSPYHDQSLDKPDLVLADLIHFLHPEFLPDYRTVFFEKLPR